MESHVPTTIKEEIPTKWVAMNQELKSQLEKANEEVAKAEKAKKATDEVMVKNITLTL